MRCVRWVTVAILLVVIAGVGVVTMAAAGQSWAATDSGSIGVDHDQLGTSWYPEQTQLTPQLVQGGSFGQLFAAHLNGDIQAQPLVEDGVLLRRDGTEHGLWAESGQWGDPVRQTGFGTPFASTSIGCSDLPGTGITGTPVVDTATNIEYFYSATYVSGTSGPAQYNMHAINVTTGAEQPNFPVRIQGTASRRC